MLHYGHSSSKDGLGANISDPYLCFMDTLVFTWNMTAGFKTLYEINQIKLTHKYKANQA